MSGSVRVVNKYSMGGINPSSVIYIGRPSIYGNPFHISEGRGMCIERYREYFYMKMKSDNSLSRAVNCLAERVRFGEHLLLKCYCKPQPCHGDVIKEYIDSVAQ